MKLFPKHSKEGSNTFYYGDWGEIPVGFSLIRLQSSNDAFQDQMHYHKVATEFYQVIEGEIVLEVDGQEVRVNADQLLMVDAKERHMVKQILSYPCIFSAISFPKGDQTDKVIS